MKIETDLKLDYKDVLLRPKRSGLQSRKDVDLKREFKFPNTKKTWKGIPIVASNMDSTGTIETAKELYKSGLLTCLHKFYSPDEIEAIQNEPFFQNIIISSGITTDDLKRLDLILKKTKPNFVCLDIANGYMQRFVEVVAKVRKDHPDIILIAGNVVTREMVEQLILSGADIVKVGIGPGSACTTRKKTGVGYPQLSAVIECSDAAHGLNGQIIADGGCVYPGDVVKAFGGGADFVMLGGMLAGHDESGGELIEENGKKFKAFYGMSSSTAMKKYYGKVNKYRASEGKTVKIPYRGPIKDTIQDILGGIRSACTYIGAKRLKDFSKCTTFIRVSAQTNDVFGSSVE